MSGQIPPTGLRRAGKRLWAEVAESFILNAGEVVMLEQACRTADELDRLEKAVRSLSELTVRGSTGQIRMHPLLDAIRAHRLTLERCLAALALPDVEEDAGLTPAQRHGQRAAVARWQDHNRVKAREAS